jgi:2-haloacid dehalogenase
MDTAVDRRRFVASTCAAVMSLPDLHLALPFQEARSAASPPPDLADVKALVFDVFGTMVDWRSSVIAEATVWGKQKGLQINWAEFTDRWRLGYQPTMDKVRKGELPWTRLDDLHRLILEDLLKQYNIHGLTEDEMIAWSHVWRRLKPWPDSVEALARLRHGYIVAPLSNGNIALMVSLARFTGFQWDAILGAELVHHYKRDPEVYNSAPYYLDLKLEEVMMVACHVGDLKAARNSGLRTGFIYRPDEYGGGTVGTPDKAQPGDFDVVATSATDFARQLGA